MLPFESEAPRGRRVFKAKPFARAARKASIADKQLCGAARDVMDAKAEDLGGGVWKKRLDQNRKRAIILGRGSRYWVFQYLFDKQNRSGIEEDELRAFRDLADVYARLTDDQVSRLVRAGDWKEICNGTEKVQE